MCKIENLKMAIFSESSYDPPAGSTTLFYLAWGESYESLMWPIKEIYDHFTELSDDDADDFASTAVATKEFIEDFSWSNGAKCCGCKAFAEGNEAVSVAISFIRTMLEDVDPYYYDEDEIEDIVQKAETYPSDYDAVIALLKLLDEQIENYNESMY